MTARKTILIVDDNPTNLRILFDHLRKVGFRVLVAEDGRTALKRLNHTVPDLILLDVMMPGMDGFETCLRLKENETVRDIPVIFMTALSDTVNKVRGFEVGAVDYITTPAHPEEVLARVNAHLTIRDLQKNLKEQNRELQAENIRRKRVQDALKESRMRYRLLAEHSTDIISRQTPQRLYLYVSPACEALLGYKIEEMVGYTFYDFLHPDDVEAIRSRYENIEELPAVSNLTHRTRRKDNSYIWLETISKIIRAPESGRAVEIIAVSRNVTERKETEEALRESEVRYRTLFDQANDVIILENANEEILDANQAAAKLLGYSHAELLTMRMTDLEPPETRFRPDSEITNSRFETVVRHRDGSRIPAEITIAPLQAGGEKLFLTILRDITERKQAEAALRRSNEELEQRVAERTQALQIEIGERKRAEESLRQYASQLEVLQLISSALRKAKTTHQMAQTLLMVSIETTQADRGILFLYNDAGLEPLLSMEGNQLLRNESVPPDELSRQAAQTGQALFVTDLTDYTLPDNLQGMRSVSIIPLKTMEIIVGVLQLAFQQPHTPTEEEERLLMALAEITGNALHRNIIMETLEQRVANRTRELAALYDVTVLASGSQELGQALEKSLDKILEAGQCQATCIHLFDQDTHKLCLIAQTGIPDNQADKIRLLTAQESGEAWVASWSHKPIQAVDLATDPGVPSALRLAEFHSYFGAPLRVKGNALGLLSLFWKTTHDLALEEVVLLSTLADQVGVAVEIARLRQRVATTAVVEERQRLARELHDAVTQSLYSQILFARTAQDALEDNEPDKLLDVLEKLSENALHTLKEMRLLLYELRPSILEQEGLVQALSIRLGTVERRVGMAVNFEVNKPVNLPKYMEVELYRITIEALNNTLKHAGADQVTVSLHTDENDRIKLEVVDNGRGFNPEAGNRYGMGLRTMDERAEMLGGKLTIISAPGEGTRLTFINYTEGE